MTDLELFALIEKIAEEIAKHRQETRLGFVQRFFEQYSDVSVVRNTPKETELYQLETLLSFFYSVAEFLDVMINDTAKEIDDVIIRAA